MKERMVSKEISNHVTKLNKHGLHKTSADCIQIVIMSNIKK